MNKLLLSIFVLLGPVYAVAQVNPPSSLIFVVVAPSNPCTTGQSIRWDYVHTKMWGCVGTTWADITGGGGGGGTPGSPAGSVQFNSAGSFGGFGSYDNTNHVLGLGEAIPSPYDAFGYLQIFTHTNGALVGLFGSGDGLGSQGAEIDMFSSGNTPDSPIPSTAGDQVLAIEGWGNLGTGAWSQVQNGGWYTDVLTNPDNTAANYQGRVQGLIGAKDTSGRTISNFQGNGYSRIGPHARAFAGTGDALDLDTDSTLTIEDKSINNITTHIIRAGPSQSTNDLTQWQNASKVVVAGVSSAGLFKATPHTPASAAEACTTGQVAWDTGFFYECISTNAWKRVALATW